jgi:hypothetical protein
MATESRSPLPSDSDPSSDELASVADALGIPVRRQVDLHLGDGVAFSLGEEGQTTLELYPTLVRVSMGDRQLALPRLPAHVSAEGVVFEDERGLLSVGATGEVLFQFVPSPAESLSTTPHTTTTARQQVSPPEAAALPVTDDSAAPATPPDETSPSSSRTREREQTKRIVKGRLIAPPTFHPNPKTQALIGEFRVAVGSKDDPETTEFVKVSCFDNPAKESFNATKLQELVEAGELTTGSTVTVVGFEHPLIRHGKQEGTQLYATVVKPTSRETRQR